MPTENEKELFNAAHDAAEAKEASKAAGGCLALSVLSGIAGAVIWLALDLSWGQYLLGAAAILMIIGLFIGNSADKIKEKYK
jgi:hypothetical protein